MRCQWLSFRPLYVGDKTLSSSLPVSLVETHSNESPLYGDLFSPCWLSDKYSGELSIVAAVCKWQTRCQSVSSLFCHMGGIFHNTPENVLLSIVSWKRAKFCSNKLRIACYISSLVINQCCAACAARLSFAHLKCEALIRLNIGINK